MLNMGLKNQSILTTPLEEVIKLPECCSYSYFIRTSKTQQLNWFVKAYVKFLLAQCKVVLPTFWIGLRFGKAYVLKIENAIWSVCFAWILT